ncbi:MAG: DMT family transporter [Elainellaceae cyanobacterium]
MPQSSDSAQGNASPVTALLRRIPGRAYLLTAVLIFATSNSVTRLLIDRGEEIAAGGPSPVSLCNVLFVGNLCALLVLIPIYQKELRPSVFRQFSASSWRSLIAVAVLSGALAPALIFTALDLTTVNNVILISRVEPPLTLALSVLFLRERVNGWVIGGAVLAFIGVALTVLLQDPAAVDMPAMGPQIGLGELLVLGGSVAAAIATVISKESLQNVPLGFFTTFRTALGTVIFFIAVLIFFSPSHFTEVFSPLLWRWMLVYGAIIVVGGQLAWFAGLQRSQAGEVSLANSFNPIAGILAAFLVLGEAPTSAQYLGGAIILAGIVCNQIGVHQSPPMKSSERVPSMKEMDLEAGFKGF